MKNTVVANELGTGLFDTKPMSLGKRLNYCIGEFGFNGLAGWTYAFMSFYFSDVLGISMAAISFMMLFVRIFDAINDPIIGSIADRTKSKMGRYRPWLIFGGIALSITSVMLFGGNPNWSSSTKIAWMWITYCLYTIAATAVNMPYGALNGVITGNATDRLKLSSMRMAIASGTCQLIAMVGIPLVTLFGGHALSAKGFTFAVALFAILGLPTLIWAALKTEEVIQPPPSQTKIPLRLQLKSIAKNPPFMFMVLGILLYGYVGTRGAFLVYFFAHNAGNPGLMTIYGLLGMIGMIIGALFFPSLLYKVIPNKGRIAGIFLFIYSLTCFGAYYIGAPTILFWILMGIGQFMGGGYIGTQYGVIPDAIDYGEYVSGVRCDGFLASFASLAMKAGSAIGPAVGLMILDKAGYVADGVQTPYVLNKINFVANLLPGIILIVCTVIFMFYRLDATRHAEICKELEARRQA